MKVEANKKFETTRNQLILWDKQYNEFRNHFFAFINKGRIDKFYRLNGKLIESIKKRDTELLNEFMEIETVDVGGVPTERVKMITVPNLSDPQAADRSIPKFKEGKTEKDYLEASRKFLEHKVFIEL